MLCSSLVLASSLTTLNAQTTEAEKTKDTIPIPNVARIETIEVESDETVQTADTGESILFLGKKLAYEAKKRLNLTTEEEEKEEEKKKEYTLRFFGIVFERK